MGITGFGSGNLGMLTGGAETGLAFFGGNGGGGFGVGSAGLVNTGAAAVTVGAEISAKTDFIVSPVSAAFTAVT